MQSGRALKQSAPRIPSNRWWASSELRGKKKSNDAMVQRSDAMVQRKSRMPCGGAASPHLVVGEPLATTNNGIEGGSFSETRLRCEAKEEIKGDGGENRMGGRFGFLAAAPPHLNWPPAGKPLATATRIDRKSTRLNSSHPV